MRRILIFLSPLVLLLGILACSTHYQKDFLKKMNYISKPQDPATSISLGIWTPDAVEFTIRLMHDQTGRGYHYHFVLDGNEIIAENFLTAREALELYSVKMKPKKGFHFQPDKIYRFCISEGSPEWISSYQDYYYCLVIYEFVLPQKGKS